MICSRYLGSTTTSDSFLPLKKASMIQDSGHFDYDSNLDAFYDYEKYGQQRIQQEQGIFTERGYIAYQGTLSLDELMRKEPAEQCQREQEETMGMGGLS